MKKLDEQRKIELKLFLTELAKLTGKYKFSIAGCGCCGSPYINDLTTDELYPESIADCLEYDTIEKEYKVTGDFL